MTKKAIVGVALFAALLLLSLNAQAGNISLGSAMGTHRFKITDEKQLLVSDGYFSVRNSKDHPADIEVTVQIELLLSDFDSSGNPRTHKVTKDIIYKEMMTDEWVIIANPSFTVQPGSSHRLDYEIRIPASSIIDDIDDGKYGYLCYLRVRETTKQEGTNVGVGYLYKVFVFFNESTVGSSIDINALLPFAVIGIGIASVIAVAYIVNKHKHSVRWSKGKVPLSKTEMKRSESRKEITKPLPHRIKYVREAKRGDQ